MLFASPGRWLCCACTDKAPGIRGLPSCRGGRHCPPPKWKCFGPVCTLAATSPFSENQSLLGIVPSGAKRDKGGFGSPGVWQKLPLRNVKIKWKSPEVLRFVWGKIRKNSRPWQFQPFAWGYGERQRGTAKSWFLGEQLTRTFCILMQRPGPLPKLPFKWTLAWEQRELEASRISPRAHFLQHKMARPLLGERVPVHLRKGYLIVTNCQTEMTVLILSSAWKRKKSLGHPISCRLYSLRKSSVFCHIPRSLNTLCTPRIAHFMFFFRLWTLC